MRGREPPSLGVLTARSVVLGPTHRALTRRFLGVKQGYSFTEQGTLRRGSCPLSES
jgi:hypothetical protein